MIIVGLLLLEGCNSVILDNIEQTEQSNLAAETNVRLAIMCLEQNYMQAARQQLINAKKLNPNNPAVWYGFGFYNEKIGELEEAKKNYEHAIMLNKKDGSAQNNYGAFLCHLGHYQNAMHHFLLAVKDPEYLDVATAYENAGLCALKMSDLELAKKYFIKAVECDENAIKSKWYLRTLDKK